MSDTDESAVLVDTPSMATLASEPDLTTEDDALVSKKSTTATTTPSNSGDEDYTEHVEIEMRDNVNVVTTGEDPPPPPHACQIVSIGSEQDKFAFHFEKDQLQSILAKVPAHATVSVVSVVGAFRTGKSFLLSWFLRYLEHLQKQQQNISTTTTSPSVDAPLVGTTSTDDANADTAWYKKFQSLGNDGFDWKAGAERNTTGIWMWSEPYMIHKNMAVLLIDTQGMFDHETTMALTASIFGFSTLLSSYQIYNVDKRIQEDNLQQLALFSEYARTAVAVAVEEEGATETVEVNDKGNVTSTDDAPKPFQHMEFLVRDWQHFEDDDGDDNYEAMAKSMETYLESVIKERDAKDLQDTREQILSCFETLSCYGLCHPGVPVTKKKYTGDVNDMDKTFLKLLVRYCKRVFDPNHLQTKVIHGRALTADQFGVFVQVYADLFASGASFPTAGTLLEATASANNTNAVQIAVAEYKEKMNRVAGPHCTNYMRLEELRGDHSLSKRQCLAKFDSIANFGNKKNIDSARDILIQEITSSLEIYESLNEGRNPLAGFEVYVFVNRESNVYFFTNFYHYLTLCPFAVHGSGVRFACCHLQVRASDFSCDLGVCRSMVDRRDVFCDGLSGHVGTAVAHVCGCAGVFWYHCRYESATNQGAVQPLASGSFRHGQ